MLFLLLLLIPPVCLFFGVKLLTGFYRHLTSEDYAGYSRIQTAAQLFWGVAFLAGAVYAARVIITILPAMI